MSAAVTSSVRSDDRERWWEIHDKDTYVCPDCHRTREQHGRRWEVHHIDRVPGRVVALCKPCHDIRHGADPITVDIEAWKAGFLGEDIENAREDRSEYL
jgi:formate-dependent nitrite reductase cytochrome c552 subunit